MTVDLDALEALAKAATSGPWEFIFGGPEQDEDGSWYEPTESGVRSSDWENDFPHADAEFIAAADPSTVLALIAELRQERERKDELEARLALAGVTVSEMLSALPRAEGAIEKLEAKSLRLSNANDGEWVEIPAEDWDAILTEYGKQKEKN